ncbi:ABC transporter ATP-binding protein [Rheinheimera marina]|uniref:ABC transporter ATP-binding protein n=1 Tax=Rheinheimera marina TaxID=1774958 RepID=A0ABV9JND1_9GAMM
MHTNPKFPALELKNLSFSWPGQAPLLQIPQLTLQQGQHLFVYGPSGSGKTTLLNLLCGIYPNQQGEIWVNGVQASALTARKRDALRASAIGVVFQQLNLIPYLTVLQNVLLISAFGGPKADVGQRAGELLNRLGLPEAFWQKKATELSVGQQQRVAIARALLNKPALLIADEPTSALDHKHRDAFMQLMLTEAGHDGTTVIFVSHDPTLKRHFHLQLDMEQLAQGVQPC